jgi:hypothetical protein
MAQILKSREDLEQMCLFQTRDHFFYDSNSFLILKIGHDYPCV